MRQFQKKYEYKMDMQLTENFHCEVSVQICYMYMHGVLARIKAGLI